MSSEKNCSDCSLFTCRISSRKKMNEIIMTPNRHIGNGDISSRIILSEKDCPLEGMNLEEQRRFADVIGMPTLAMGILGNK